MYKQKQLTIIVCFRDYSATSMERQVKFLAVIKFSVCMLDFLLFFGNEKNLH